MFSLRDCQQQSTADVNRNMVLIQKLGSKRWNSAYHDANPQAKKHDTRPVIHNNSYDDSKYNQ